MTAGTLDRKLDSTAVPTKSVGGFVQSMPAWRDIISRPFTSPDCAMALLTTNNPMKSTSRCQSICPSISRDAIRRLMSSTPAATSAITSRGHGENRNASITAAMTTAPF